MNDAVSHIFSSPVFFILLTLLAYGISEVIFLKTKYFPLFNPVLLTIIIVVSILSISGINYQTYFKNVQIINFLIGPSTVALAIPLYRAYEEIKKSAFAIIATLIIGSIFAIISAFFTAFILGGSKDVMLSFAPRSATSPIAIGISEAIGGLPPLTAALVILTGIIAAMLSSFIFNTLRIKDKRARGFATGLVAHGIGTAHKLRIDEKTGAFASLAMALNGVATAIFTPILVPIMLKLIGQN